MPKRRYIYLFCTLLAGLGAAGIFLALRAGRPPRTVRVGLARLTPFEPLRVNDVPSGLLVDLLEAAAARKGLKLDWIDVTEGGDVSLEKGVVDIWPAMAAHPSREKTLHITKAYLQKDFCLVSPKAAPIRSPAETTGRKLALVNGPFTRALAQSYFPAADRRILSSRTNAIVAVCRGEVDAAFSETSYFQLYLLQGEPACASFPFEISPVPGPVIRMGLASRIEHARVAETLRDGIEELREDGDFSRLLGQWMPVALGENGVLFQEQKRRIRSFRIATALSAGAALLLLLLCHNRRISRARRLTESANQALERSVSQLRDAHQRLHIQVDRMPLACVVCDEGFRIREWNPAAEQIFGWTAGEAKGRLLGELLLPSGQASAAGEIWSGVAAGEEPRCRVQENVARDGRKLVCEWVSAPLRNERGEATGVLSLVHDVTERKRLEEDLRQAHKLESIGRLAGGVAHDFNNLLTVINGNADLLLAQPEPDEAGRESLAEIRRAGERAANLTHQLLAFSRKQILQPRPLDLNAQLREHEGMFRRLLGEDIVLEFRPGAGLGLVMADAVQIHQVLLNLLANARDAMPNGGLVVVATANVEQSAADCAGHPGAAPGPFVELSVSDSGVGMDQETGKRIFEPFFTTKSRATATGLGLPMVHGVVSQSGGWVEVSSEVGRGTTFLIRLPRMAGARRPAEPHADAAPAIGTGTVLLVEDQESVRKLAAAMLKKSGYTVLQAEDGQAAIALAERHPGPIDLLLTDLVMPGMGGPEAASVLRRLRPQVRVLYMSGYGADANHSGAGEVDGAAVLAKPFTPAALTAAVQAALAAAQA